jgi:hypothetical protein
MLHEQVWASPLSHICWREDRNPGPFFDTSWYRFTHNYTGQDCPLSAYLSLPEPNMRHIRYSIDVTVNCYVDYVRNGINAGRLPNRHYGTISDFINKVSGASRDDPGRAVGRELHTKASEAKLRHIAGEQCGILDTHYEVWQSPDTLEGKVVCPFAAFAPNGYLPRSTLYFLSALRRHGVAVIVVCNTQNSGKPYSDDTIECDGLIRRDNFGFDFAGWYLGYM